MTRRNGAISVQDISKCYRLGMKEDLHDSIGGAIIEFMKSPVKNYRRYRSLYTFDEFSVEGPVDAPDIVWALRGVSFDISPGEAVGIIGRNGAGKSTLLKVLSRITHPTRGRAELRGRISSLLEVGTGFHPELTGRENIYLNGTILGMKKRELDRKFEEIVEFSGVSKFIDTPVKRYSSGMKVRLAFSVASHLEPEILIVDEVLAVGDSQFQKKCLHKMENIGHEGRTVLFVSHNMPAVTRLCKRAIMLDEGRLFQDGLSSQVVKTYMSAGGKDTAAAREWPDPASAPGGEAVRLRAVRVRSEDGEIADTADIRHPVHLEMEYEVLKPGYTLLPHYSVYNEDSQLLFMTLDRDATWKGRPRPRGLYRSTASIPGNFFSEGTLFVTAAMLTLSPDNLQFFEHDAVAFQIVDSPDGDSARGDWGGNLPGAVRPLFPWSTEYRSNGHGLGKP